MVMFTTDPIYKKPLIPRITIKSLDNATTYYTYDPWTDSGTTTKAIGCNVQLSQNHQGIFQVQIEDESKAISSNVNLGARVIIECGKQSTQMTRLISGIIRQKGYTRGADKQVIYNLSGSSTAIRLNELIINIDTSARKLLTDNITIDTSDPNFVADQLLQTQLATLTTEGVASASGLTTRSDVKSFIPSLAVSFGELQDVCNLIEEQTNGEIFIDVNDLVQFRHQFQPPIAGRGFTIKNKNATNDNADDTCYLRGRNWNYIESCLKSDGYSSRVYGILPAETLPSQREDIGWGNPVGAFAQITNGLEVAQKFRPPHSHFLPGDIYIVGSQYDTNASGGSNWGTWFRICNDASGVPQNAGGIVVNLFFTANQWPNPVVVGSASSNDLPILTNDQIFLNTSTIKIGSFDLDTTKDYWMIAANIGIGNNRVFAWGQDTSVIGIPTGGMQHSSNFSTPTAGGSGWSAAGGRPCLVFPRRRSQAYECADPKAVAAIGSGISTGGTRIESTLTNIPSGVKTKETMQKYLVNQLYYMARPRANWNMATVTAPNVPIMPGDPIMISDSVMGFSTAGTQAVITTCGDMTYSWQIGQYQAPTILSIQPVNNPTRYK